MQRSHADCGVSDEGATRVPHVVGFPRQPAPPHAAERERCRSSLPRGKCHPENLPINLPVI